MPVQLGGAFQTPAPPSPPTGDERRHVELLAELAALRDTLIALAQQPAPQVMVAPTDMSEILYALEGLGISPAAPVVDPRSIGEAVADALNARQVMVPDRTDEVLEELKRIGRKFGVALANSAPVVSNDIADRSDRALGKVSVTNFPAQIDALTDAQLPVFNPNRQFTDATPTTVWRSTALTGGTVVAVGRQPQNVPFPLPVTTDLLPGQSYSISASAPALGTAFTLYASVFFLSIPL